MSAIAASSWATPANVSGSVACTPYSKLEGNLDIARAPASSSAPRAMWTAISFVRSAPIPGSPFLWILQSCSQLVLHFAQNERRQHILAFRDVLADGARFALRQFPQRPRKRLRHHRITVALEQPANLKRALCFAHAAPRFAVQRHCTHQRRAAPPTVRRSRPAANQAVRDLPLTPRRPRQVHRKTIDCAPARYAAPEPFELLRVQSRESTAMMMDQLVGHKAVIHPRHAQQSLGQLNHYVRLCIFQLPRIFPPHPTQFLGRRAGHAREPRFNLRRQLCNPTWDEARFCFRDLSPAAVSYAAPACVCPFTIQPSASWTMRWP